MTRVAPAVLVVAMIGLLGCGVPTQRVAHTVPDGSVPSGLLDPSTPTSTTLPSSTATADVTICLAAPLGPLVTVSRQVRAGAKIDELMNQLAQTPSPQERAVGLTTLVTSGDTVSVDSGVATVKLGSDFASSSSADQLTAVAQIVCTLTNQPGIGQVQFQLDNANTGVPRGDGSTTDGLVSRSDYPQWMPASPT